jgi:hypothetical protein
MRRWTRRWWHERRRPVHSRLGVLRRVLVHHRRRRLIDVQCAIRQRWELVRTSPWLRHHKMWLRTHRRRYHRRRYHVLRRRHHVLRRRHHVFRCHSRILRHHARMLRHHHRMLWHHFRRCERRPPRALKVWIKHIRDFVPSHRLVRLVQRRSRRRRRQIPHPTDTILIPRHHRRVSNPFSDVSILRGTENPLPRKPIRPLSFLSRGRLPRDVRLPSVRLPSAHRPPRRVFTPRSHPHHFLLHRRRRGCDGGRVPVVTRRRRLCVLLTHRRPSLFHLYCTQTSRVVSSPRYTERIHGMINTHARARVTRFVEETRRPSVRPSSVGRSSSCAARATRESRAAEKMHVTSTCPISHPNIYISHFSNAGSAAIVTQRKPM